MALSHVHVPGISSGKAPHYGPAAGSGQLLTRACGGPQSFPGAHLVSADADWRSNWRCTGTHASIPQAFDGGLAAGAILVILDCFGGGGGSFRGLRQPPHSYPPGQELHGPRKVHQLLSALITHGEPNEPVHGEPNFLRDSVHYLDPQASVGRWPQ